MPERTSTRTRLSSRQGQLSATLWTKAIRSGAGLWTKTIRSGVGFETKAICSGVSRGLAPLNALTQATAEPEGGTDSNQG